MRFRASDVLAVGVLLIAAAVLFRGHLLRATGSVAPLCARAEPNVILCEDFESGAAPGWEVGSNRGHWPSSQFVLCTNDSFGFHDRCAAWSNALAFDTAWGFYGHDARRAFPAQSEFYVRWYQYVSDPYVWGTLEDKSVMLHDAAQTLTVYVGTSRNQLPQDRDSGPGRPFVANYQDLDWRDSGGQSTKVNRFQNQGHNLTLQPGRWYLFEWYLKLNTPGASDGVTKLWIDDASRPIATQTLRMHHADMRWLRTGDAGKHLDVLRLLVYHQRCDGVPNTCPPNGPPVLNQSQRWDRIVVSTAPIGPVADSPAPADRSASR
ncbi:MAG TPA: hypothetical protein VJX66_30435 [Amycolatopsis sp.]|nr:hypothetical protein [Amycolatopsis sp.]